MNSLINSSLANICFQNGSQVMLFQSGDDEIAPRKTKSFMNSSGLFSMVFKIILQTSASRVIFCTIWVD